MRGILFRGKAKDNIGWVEGYYAVIGAKNVIIKSRAEDYYSVDGSVRKSHGNEIIEIDPCTICQYTGMTDKNGRKIFEGDIVRDVFNASVVGVVRYGEYRNTFNDDEHGGHAGFYIEWKEKKGLLRKDLVYWVKNSGFIGNIFDNPELIQEG